MSERPQVSLILPAYNEVKSIEQTIRDVERYFTSRGTTYEIIVAADGDDGTRELVGTLRQRNSRIKVTGTNERGGKGRGIRTAMKIADGIVIGFVDADNKVPINEFDKIEPWLQQGFHVVMGSRTNKDLIERQQNWYRRLGSRGFALVLHALLGLKGIKDTQCGFKFFPAQAAKQLFANQVIDGYMFDVEILVLAKRFGFHIKEVPIRWRDDGDSRLVLFSGNIRNLTDVLRIRWSRLHPVHSLEKNSAVSSRRA